MMEVAATQLRRDDLTFKANLRTTRYGWLRLTPAYSVHLVRELVSRADPKTDHVLDPFCGTGTTALVCGEEGVSVTTTDINPFLVWLTQAKCATYTGALLGQFLAAARTVRGSLLKTDDTAGWVPPIHQIEKWWDERTLRALARAMARIRAGQAQQPHEVIDLLKVAFCRVMIGAANVHFGHQSMSFRARNGDPELFAWDPVEQLAVQWDRSVSELANSASTVVKSSPTVLHCDARQLANHLPKNQYSLVVTSPPYPNRMSYVRELRPYMYWLEHLRDGREAGELDWQAIGGTWGVATSRLTEWNAGNALNDYPAIAETCKEIALRSDVLSRYVARYFVDMAEHCSNLYQVVKEKATIHYIVGNSKFYDVVLPVEQFYAQMLTFAGFRAVEVHQIRKRTSKRELFEYRVSAKK